MTHDTNATSPTLFGHPAGLFTLFFAEMWERFSYYGMRALLVFYMLKGFLRYGDGEAYAVYGAYTALVYMTPLFGGLLADRLLGARRAVLLGGLLMAAGHLLMTVESRAAFFSALALLICGNGFFKPNISTIVGGLYPAKSTKRDGGFTIFYMGINLGAAMSPLLCGYIGETYGWHYGFGLATLGMLTGLAVFANWLPPGDVGAPPDRARLRHRPVVVTQSLIMLGVLSAVAGLLLFCPDNPVSIAVNVFVAISLLAAGVIGCLALRSGAGGLITVEWTTYLGTLLTIPLFALLVSGFAPLRADQHSVRLIPDWMIAKLDPGGILALVLGEVSRPAGLVLMLAGVLALAYLAFETFRLDRIARQRMYVVLILTFFSMLFWAFFEQAGSSINNFTDRNVDRVFELRTVTADEIGQTISIQPTQEQLGYTNGGRMFTLGQLDQLRGENARNLAFEIPWRVAEDNVGMGIAPRVRELPASTFQAVNPICILSFGLVFTALWTVLARYGWEPSTPVKFAFGLMQLGLGFGVMWYGTRVADARGMVGLWVLLVGYLLQTTGELCLSPVGLAMVTRLSPARLVSTVMGAWFLATAFSQFLAAIIAQFTGVQQTDGDGATTIPIPLETVHVYGEVFGKIAIAALISAVFCFLIAPLLKRWMHEGAVDTEPE